MIISKTKCPAVGSVTLETRLLHCVSVYARQIRSGPLLVLLRLQRSDKGQTERGQRPKKSCQYLLRDVTAALGG